MIHLNFTEQELFDVIMALYLAASSGNSANPESHEVETATRRKALLDKLHEAFDRNNLARQSADVSAVLS